MVTKNGIEIYSTHNEWKSFLAERFIKSLKIKIYEHITSFSKNFYIDIVNKYNNTYHSTIKMKPTDVKSNTYIDPSNEINNTDPKFKIGDNFRMSKYKNVFANVYTPNWLKTFFVIKKSYPWTYLINDLNGEEIVGTFCENELQKTNEKEFRIEKIINRKGNKLYAKWKGYDSSFNSWIDRKDIV